MAKQNSESIPQSPEKKRDLRLKEALRENLRKRKQAGVGLTGAEMLRRDGKPGDNRK